MKKCFDCGFNLPLFFFRKNRMKYQLKSGKGYLTNCRICCANELYKQDGVLVRYNWEVKKFEIKKVKISFKNWFLILIGKI